MCSTLAILVCFIGFVETVDDDGVGYFRLAQDALIMFETGSHEFDQHVPAEMKVSRTRLRVFAVGC